jgi:hypothetical protein
VSGEREGLGVSGGVVVGSGRREITLGEGLERGRRSREEWEEGEESEVRCYGATDLRSSWSGMYCEGGTAE